MTRRRAVAAEREVPHAGHRGRPDGLGLTAALPRRGRHRHADDERPPGRVVDPLAIGSEDGVESPPCASAIDTGAPPSAGTDQRRDGAAEYVANTMRRLSGDQVGEAWPPIGWPGDVRRAAVAAVARHRPDGRGHVGAIGPGRDVGEAIRLEGQPLPVRDQAGSDPNSVECWAAPPRAGTIQIPPRLIE